MAYPIPTTKEIAETNKANLEAYLNQDSPPVDIAFLNVLALTGAFTTTGLYKYAADRAKGNLALTAIEPDLELIGENLSVPRKAAEAAILTQTLTATTGTIISQSNSFIGDANGVRYFPDAEYTSIAGVVTMTVTAESTGVVGNLNVGETMSISNQVAGAETVATITVVDNIGAEIEDLEVYRQRVLFADRGVTGGSNAADYKIWSEEVAGVKTAYPYSGKPFDVFLTSFPGDRTVYIEAETNIDPDGIPPTSLLDEVRAVLNIDPDTGLSRPCLGLTDDTLYVEKIERKEFFVKVINIQIQSDLLSQVETDIESAVEVYFLAIAPFVVGIDFQEDRKDIITPVTVSEVVQNILTAAGGSCEEVTVGETVITTFSTFTLNPGILAKSGGVSFV